jgi:hypothetical protein
MVKHCLNMFDIGGEVREEDIVRPRAALALAERMVTLVNVNNRKDVGTIRDRKRGAMQVFQGKN